MLAMSTVAERLLTIDEYAQRTDDGEPTELVRGRVITLQWTMPRDGQICVEVACLLGNYVTKHDLGHVVGNDSGVITERNPDTLRGADVAYYSYAKLPKGPLPDGYLSVVPDLVFEVRSTTDRWAKVLEKVAELLEAGVSVACVLDPEQQTVLIFRADQPVQLLNADEDFTVPEILGDFRVPVRKFFE